MYMNVLNSNCGLSAVTVHLLALLTAFLIDLFLIDFLLLYFLQTIASASLSSLTVIGDADTAVS